VYAPHTWHDVPNDEEIAKYCWNAQPHTSRMSSLAMHVGQNNTNFADFFKR